MGTIYQQQLRYIQDHDLDTNPRRMFREDFVAVLKTWRKQGDRIMIGIDMNEPILDGPLSEALLGAGIDLEDKQHTKYGELMNHTRLLVARVLLMQFSTQMI